MSRGLHPLVACAAGAIATLAASSAGASAPLCSALPLNSPRVVIENGDTQEPMLKALGQALANAPTPLRILYFNKSTCLLAADKYNGASIAETTAMSYAPSSLEDATWDPSKPSPTCLPDPGGFPIDLAIGATYLTSCTTLPAKPANITVLGGPIQGYGFVVPSASSQVAMTAEEGYFAFGWPMGGGMADPWTDQTLRFIRGASASTALTCSANIGLLASKLQGTLSSPDRSTPLLQNVATSPTPEKTIGLLGVDVSDGHRDEVKMLAFRAFHQLYAYFPDSSNTVFDKQNVRDGHYVPWSPTQYIFDDAAASADTHRVIDLVFGNRVDPGVNGVYTLSRFGLVPQCAMHVTRQFDGGDLSLYSDPAPCDCLYDSAYPGATKTCTVCSNDSACGGGKCRRGICEAK
ncbi:MAG TPA: hypothetical protein VIF62_14050 [Labilithrix sp.]